MVESVRLFSVTMLEVHCTTTRLTKVRTLHCKKSLAVHIYNIFELYMQV